LLNKPALLFMVYALALIISYVIVRFSSWATEQRRGIGLTLEFAFWSVFLWLLCLLVQYRILYTIRLETKWMISFILYYFIVDSLISWCKMNCNKFLIFACLVFALLNLISSGFTLFLTIRCVNTNVSCSPAP